MRRGRMLGGLAAIGAAAVMAAPAGAATPNQVYTDLAKNGVTHYSGADVRAALKNASVQGYGNPIVVVTLKPAVETRTAPAAAGPGTEGVAAAQKTVVRRAPLAAAAKRSGTLPFTGQQLTVLAVIGALLLCSGLLLRATAREKSNR